MTDQGPDDPQQEIQRLTAELASRERENSDLKEELAHTKEVRDKLWSHDIYLTARKKMLGGVFAVLGVLSAFGLVTVYELYQNGLNFIRGEMKDTANSHVQAKMPEMIEDAKPEINEQVDKVITALIDDAKKKIDTKIAELNNEVQIERVSLAEQARQIRLGMAPPAKAEPVGSAILQTGVVCDPNYLDQSQVARVAVRQLSEGTGRQAPNGREVFMNTVFLDVRETDAPTGAAETKCILDAVDRVVYDADPKWYSPSEFVRVDRETEFRFTISGWGPTELGAQVYLIGRRDPLMFDGRLAIRNVAVADKHYLGDAPVDFQ